MHGLPYTGSRATLGFGWLAAYIGTIFGANWALATFGTFPVWGIAIPAGTLMAGLSFTFRDLTQEALGRGWTVAAVLLGALLAALVSPQFALASGTAFLTSELLDLVVYTPLRERHFLGAVAASNTVGLLVDSVLFLLLAFGSLDFLVGQVVGKVAMTVLAVAVLAAWRFGRRAPAARPA